MTVLRAQALDSQGKPVAGRTAVLEPWTGNRYRSSYNGPGVVRGLTAVSGSDGWMSWTLPALQRRPGPRGALWMVTGLEAQPVVLATQPGDTTTTGTRVGTVSPLGDLVPTPVTPVDTSAQATAAAQAAVSTITAGAPASLDTLAEIAAELQGRLSTASLGAAFAPYRAALFTPPMSPVTVVSTMDSGWTHLDTGAAVHDATIFDTGAGSLKITPAGDGGKSTARLTFTAQDWSNQAFAFRFRTDDWASIIDGYLLVSTSGSFAQFFRVQITPKMSRVVNGEWSEITLTRGDFTFNSGTAAWTTVNGVMFQLYSAAGKTPSLWIDQFLRYTTPAKATVSFAFDDGFATTITSAKPAMDKYGYRGTAFIMPSALNTSAYMTQAQIDTLAAQGWDIGGHNVTDLTTMTAAAAEADVLATKAYLVNHGYKGGDVYAYPLGGQSFALRAMVGKYFNAARGTSTFGQTRAYVNRRNMMARQVGTPVTLAAAKLWVDQAVANQEWLIITGHKLTASPVAAEDWTPIDFAALVDYVATTAAQVLPVSEALAQVG